MINLIVIPVLIIAPVVILLVYFRSRDIYGREPWSLIWILFGIGCIGVIPAAVIEFIILGFEMELETMGDAFMAAFVGVALVEEGVKFILVYLFTFKNRHFDEEYDGIIYAVAVGLGFAFFENLLYVLIAVVTGQGGLMVAIMRAFTAIPMHAFDGVILGFYLGQARFLDTAGARWARMFKGLFVAVLFHGTYDFFIFAVTITGETATGLLLFSGVLVTMIIQWVVAFRMVRIAQVRSGEQKARLAQIPSPAEISTTPLVKRFCHQCGGGINPGNKFCAHCGIDLE